MKTRWLCLLMLTLFACKNEGYSASNNTNNSNNDTGNYILSFHAPASGELNLLTGSSTLVFFKVSDARGEPVADTQLDFMIVGQAGGSSLSASFAVTDTEGIAGISVNGGTTPAHFEIAISHVRAAPITLDVTVSASGMANFEISFTYDGVRGDEIDSVEAGLIFNSTCDGSSILLLPFSRERHLNSITESVRFDELAVDVPFAFVGRMKNADGEYIGSGCLVPPPDVLVPGGDVDLELPLTDYLRTLDGTEPLTLTAAASSVSAWLSTELSPWNALGRCTYGVGTKFFDCMLAYLEGGDPAACTRGIPTTLSAEIDDLRGLLDGSGCRGALNSHGGASLESMFHGLSEHIGELQALLAQVRQYLALGPFEQITITTTLSPQSGGLLLSPVSVTFPVVSEAPLPISAAYAESAPVWLLYDGRQSTFSLPGYGFTLGIGEIALNLLWMRYFIPMEIPLSGTQLMEIIKGYIQEQSATTWDQELINLINPALTTLDIERTLALYAATLNYTLPVPAQFDATLTGELSFGDEDADGTVDLITPELSLSVDPSGALTLE